MIIMKQQFSHSSSHKNEVQKIVFHKNVSISVLSIFYSFLHLKAHCIYKRRTQTRFRK